MKQEKILKIIGMKNTGKTITELVNISNFSRSAVRTVIAKLEGANKIHFINIGMAKVYFLNEKKIRRSRIIPKKRIRKDKKNKKINKIFLIFASISILILSLNVVSSADVLVWQGQYYTGTTFNSGTYEF
ncbi:MAG: hypothetical protein NUV46_00765, partial [Nanoarchaeota archaeon]|nr:hypothetical protein [Nanoarchaeota archaeon]